MATDTKLLPLPELPVAVERFILSSLGPVKREGAVTALRTMLREYARANVAHATAAQAAEIEALRAKASEHRDGRLAALEQAKRYAELLTEIGHYAHDHSTGPAVPDALWTIRNMAYDG